MDNPKFGLPENADKLLFAEDLVSYVMTNLYFDSYEGTTAAPYRDFIHNAFNDVVKVTVNEIGDRLILHNYLIYDVIKKLDPVKDLYQEIIDNLSASYHTDGFEPELFMMFSISVANIGAIMRNKGFEEAAEMAISAIYEFIKNVDMLNTGWDTLTMSCLPIFNTLQAINSVLTPKRTLFSDSDGMSSESEDDSQMSSWDKNESEDDSQMSSWDKNESEDDSQMSSSDKNDSAEDSESNVENPMEQNAVQVNIADALALAINASSNSRSLDLLRREHNLQPNSTVEIRIKGIIKNAENCLLSCLSKFVKSSESVDSLQEDETSTLVVGVNSEPEKNLTDSKDSKVETDSPTSQNNLQLQKNTAHPPPVEECKVLSDDDCKMGKQEDNAEDNAETSKRFFQHLEKDIGERM